MSNKININTPNLPIPQVKKPQCPKHHAEMTFNVARSRWSCVVDGCTLTAKRKGDDSALPTVKWSKVVPIAPTWVRLDVLESDDEEERYVLYFNDKQKTYAIDVSDYTEMLIDDSSGQATLCLLISNVSR